MVEQRYPRGPVVLVGHSMGGMTLMTFARQHPDLVRDRVAGAFLLATSAGRAGGRAASLGAVVKIGTRLHLLPLWLRACALSPRCSSAAASAGRSSGYRFYERFLFGCDDAEPELVRLVQDLLEACPLTTSAGLLPELPHPRRARQPAGAGPGADDGAGRRLRPADPGLPQPPDGAPRSARRPGSSSSRAPATASTSPGRQVVDEALLELLDRVAARAGAA